MGSWEMDLGMDKVGVLSKPSAQRQVYSVINDEARSGKHLSDVNDRASSKSGQRIFKCWDSRSSCQLLVNGTKSAQAK